MSLDIIWVITMTLIWIVSTVILGTLMDWVVNKPARDMDKRIANAYANRIKGENK